MDPIEIAGKPAREVDSALRERMERAGLMEELDYFHLSFDWRNWGPQACFPESYRWIACYPVTGGSEGHYIHVDLLDRDGVSRVPLFLGKTFSGMDTAAEVALFCAKALGA